MNKYTNILNMVRNAFSFRLPVVIIKQGKKFIAYSPVLDISTSSSSRKNILEKFTEIANLFLEEIKESGTIDDVLSELGWKKIKKQWNPPQVISSESIGIKLPAIA